MTGPAPAEARFGIPQLDELLHGLFRGENVFWGLAEDAAASDRLVSGLCGAIAGSGSFGRHTLIAADGVPPRAGFHIVHVAPQADDLLDALAAGSGSTAGDAVAIDLRQLRAAAPGVSLDRDVARIAHHTLRHGIVTHWFDSTSEEGDGLQSLAQCVIEARGGQLRIVRADGRGPEVRGAMLPYQVTADEHLAVGAPTAASRLGRGLRAIRGQRGWTQSQLAELVGVSGSAISQAERGQHALSLETVVDLATKLGLTVDHLLHGVPLPYELARADGTGRERRPRLLLDSVELNLRTVGIRIPPRGAASPIFRADHHQILLVATGLVQVILPSARPVLRQGDALTVHAGGVTSCRNLGDDEALVFWHEHG